MEYIAEDVAGDCMLLFINQNAKDFPNDLI